MSVRHSVSRSVSILAAVAGPLTALVVASAAPVRAAPPYPPPPPGVTVNTTAITPGGAFVLSFSGFGPGESVSIDLHSVTVHLGTATAGSDGSGSTSVTIPAGFSGSHEIVLTGAVSGRVAAVEIEISAGGGGSSLPDTGLAGRSFGLVAGALIVAGLVFLGASRARRRRAG